MTRKALLIAGLATGLAISAPAQAGGTWWGSSSSTSTSSGGLSIHKHKCGCGHIVCTSTSSSTGGTTGGSTGGTTGGSTGGTTGGSTGGTTGGSTGGEVPEPGMLGMLGLGLIGVGYARRRRARK